MFWVHCNQCMSQPGQGKSYKFYITNCGHVFCRRCVEKCRDVRKCTVPSCGTSPVKSRELNENVDPDAKLLFDSLPGCLTEIYKTAEFQMGQYRNLVSLLDAQLEQLQSDVEATRSRLTSQCVSIKEKNSQLRLEISKRKQRQVGHRVNNSGRVTPGRNGWTVVDMVVTPAVTRRPSGNFLQQVTELRNPSSYEAVESKSSRVYCQSTSPTALLRRKVTDWLRSM